MQTATALVVIAFFLLLCQPRIGARRACFHPRCLRIRGGSAGNRGEGQETELERHRLWQACAVACHASYLHGTQSDGDHLEKAKSFIERACMDGVPMADTLEALESTEHWSNRFPTISFNQHKRCPKRTHLLHLGKKYCKPPRCGISPIVLSCDASGLYS